MIYQCRISNYKNLILIYKNFTNNKVKIIKNWNNKIYLMNNRYNKKILK